MRSNCWQIDGKGGTAAGGIADFHAPAMVGDDSLGDGQAEAETEVFVAGFGGEV